MGHKIIFGFIKKNKLTYLLGIVFMFTSSYLQTLFPRILGDIIDILRQDTFNLRIIKTDILYLLLIATGTFISTYLWRNLVIGNSRKIECYLRERLFDHFQELPSEFYNRRKTGDLIAYAINDISAIRMTFGPATAMSINGIVLCIASIYSMCIAINWRLTLICLLPIPVIVFVILKTGRTVQKKFKRVQESFATISDRVQENINGIRVIKSYVQEEQEVSNFENLNSEMFSANISMVKTSSLLSPIIDLCFSVSFSLNLIIGGNMVLKNTISLGAFVAFNTYLVMIMAPIISIGRVITILQRGMASLKRLNDIFSVEPEIKDGININLAPIEGEIEFKNLTYTYPNTSGKVLNNINLKIPKGHTLAIIGKTGSGKSTLANLLIKMYNTEKGTIFIDGVDLNDYSLKTLREGFGYVPQDNFLFSASIKDNIKFFKNIYTEEQVENASKLSCIYESIKNLPKGFNTNLGERGVNLSGGQKQRISIARALIKTPAILILDDSLSAVDTITEGKILDNLKAIRNGKTAIIICHRISAAMDADEIVVLNKGTIHERGTHKELLKKGGLYYDIYKEQKVSL